MPSKHSLNVSLTNELCGFVSEQVASGRFRTSSEVVRAALRLLEKEAKGSHSSSSLGVAQRELAGVKAKRAPPRSQGSGS
jgi:putative addiction module CopG family antidote